MIEETGRNRTSDPGSDTRESERSDETRPAELTEAELVRVEATTTSLAEKLLEGLSPLVEAGIEAFSDDRERKDAIRRQEIQTDREATKRHTWLLGGAVGCVAILSLIALLLNQLEFAELVLGSALAVAAGAGLKAAVRRRKD